VISGERSACAWWPVIAGVTVALWCSMCPCPAVARVYELSPEDDWFRVIQGSGLQPGDEVILAGGVYRDARRLVMGHRGTAQRPIVIRSAPGATAVLHRPDARQNSINIEGAQYLVLRDLEITGGSTGIRLRRSGQHPCKFVTLEGLHIHHVGGPAVTANNPGNAYEGLVFRGNHIHHTSVHAEGFYLGVNNKADGSTAGYIFDSIIEGNYIHDLKGPNVLQGDGIEIKDGSHNNIVRDNVIHDTNYPGILVYGTDGKAPNIVERNVIWNSGDNGIQAAAEAVIRNNIVFNSGGDGIYSRAHQSARVGHLQITHNTVVSNRAGGAALRVALPEQRQVTGPVLIANNGLYAFESGFALRLPAAEVAARRITVAGNVGSGPAEGLPRRVALTVWNPQGQLARDLDEAKYPRRGSALLGAADARFVDDDDFNGTARRNSRDAGAYLFNDRGNPGWQLSAGFKTTPRRSGP
jgi:parallel beta-helix repeat protein